MMKTDYVIYPSLQSDVSLHHAFQWEFRNIPKLRVTAEGKWGKASFPERPVTLQGIGWAAQKLTCRQDEM